MNEEQAVLNFFAQPENFPLGLSVAEQMDGIREQQNNRYWRDLLPRLDALISDLALPWECALTEDKNAPDNLVGLHCTLSKEQPIYLRLMLEQQYLGGAWRIYFGLMWSSTPTPEQLALPAICALKQSLQDAGHKNNANFLAWQWTAFHPRRRDFLLRYSQHPEAVLGETVAILGKLLTEHRSQIEQANDALQAVPRSMAVSLDQLRSKRGT